MGRQSKKCPKKCQNHHFHLKPVHYSAFLSRQTSFLYCPPSLKAQQIIPKFNKDGKSYTPSFILAVDQLKLNVNSEAYKMQHERLKTELHDQKSQILIPRPKAKHSYCNVCKNHYEDYLEHINSFQHKKNIQVNPFNRDILQLCQNIQAQNQVLNEVQSKEIWNSSMQSTQFSELFMESDTEKDRRFLTFFDNFEGLKDQQKPMECFFSLKSTKSFQSCKDNQQNMYENVLNSSIFKQYNQNPLNQNLACFKQVSCTASPMKAKLERPIIISSCKLNFDS